MPAADAAAEDEDDHYEAHCQTENQAHQQSESYEYLQNILCAL